MKKYKAVIDIGSNTVQFLLVDENMQTFERKQFVTSLGRDLDKNRMFHEDSMQATFEALKTCKEFIERYHIPAHEVKMTATEASRVAGNSDVLYSKILQELGLKVQIIDPKEEARLSAKGYLFGKDVSENNQSVILDIGGASSEIILVKHRPFKVIKSLSLPIGSVRVKGWSDENEDLLSKRIDDIFIQKDFSIYETNKLIGLAGTATSLIGVHLGLEHFDEALINDKEISLDEMKKLSLKLKNKKASDLLLQHPFLGKRAEVLRFGLMILEKFQEQIGFESFVVSTRSLVHGSIQG